MKIFITASFQGGNNKKEIEYLCELIQKAGFEDFCFIRDVEKYKKIFDNPQELMQQVKDEINKSDALLIDMTTKPIGRIIEAGIAFALNKKVIVIAKKGTQMEDTTKGISNLIIEYDVIGDIVTPLKKWLSKK
jgi:nucleoside 2-deoxyribosyltransferase